MPVETRLLIACDTGFYAIIKVKMSLHLHPNSTLCMRAANALVSLRISACSSDPLMLSIAIKVSLCWHYFMNFLYHIYIEIKYYSLKKLNIKIEQNKILKNIKKNTQNKKISRRRKYTMETNEMKKK